MKWLLPTLGSTATVAVLAHAGLAQEPLAGVEFVPGDTAVETGSARLGTFEIDGLERAVSARTELSTDKPSSISLPPGLYGFRFVPDPDALAAPAMAPGVFLVTPRAVTRVGVRLRVAASGASDGRRSGEATRRQ